MAQACCSPPYTFLGLSHHWVWISMLWQLGLPQEDRHNSVCEAAPKAMTGELRDIIYTCDWSPSLRKKCIFISEVHTPVFSPGPTGLMCPSSTVSLSPQLCTSAVCNAGEPGL